MQQFSQLGAQVHLDDLVTATLHFRNWRAFGIGAIKLDQVFVRDIHKQPALAVTGPGDRRCGPGIQSSGDRRRCSECKGRCFLTKNGINERQGFLFAKPMPAVAFERWYKTLPEAHK
ncbi:hypothetical protein ACLK1T_29235 [Escherichia coli]